MKAIRSSKFFTIESSPNTHTNPVAPVIKVDVLFNKLKNATKDIWDIKLVKIEIYSKDITDNDTNSKTTVWWAVGLIVKESITVPNAEPNCP